MSKVATKTAHFENDDQKQKFDQFVSKQLPAILKDADYDELFGYQLTSTGEYFDKEVHDALIFKFLKANEFELEATKTQLLNTLKWRKEFDPLSAAFNETHDPKFDKIGLLTDYPENKDNTRVITWNLYGAGGNPKQYFEDLNKFLRYRIGLMERGVQLLDFTSPDRNFLTQVHDYKGVSFLKMDSDVKSGTKATIHIFQSYYPEMLYKKFFVNVPSVMYWIYEFIKRLLPTTTTKKFYLLNNSKVLVNYLGTEVPKNYGGKGEELSKQNVLSIKPPVYGAHVVQQTFANEVD